MMHVCENQVYVYGADPWYAPADAVLSKLYLADGDGNTIPIV